MYFSLPLGAAVKVHKFPNKLLQTPREMSVGVFAPFVAWLISMRQTAGRFESGSVFRYLFLEFCSIVKEN